MVSIMRDMINSRPFLMKKKTKLVVSCGKYMIHTYSNLQVLGKYFESKV